MFVSPGNEATSKRASRAAGKASGEEAPGPRRAGRQVA